MPASSSRRATPCSVTAALGLIVLAFADVATAQTPLQTAQALQAQIMAAYNAGHGDVTIAPGDYEVAGSGNAILSLSGLSDFTINATGVRLIAKELKQVVRLTGADNLTVNGLAIDYDPLPFTQGTVTRVSGSSFDVRIHDGYSPATGSPRVIAYDPQTRQVKDGTATRYDVGLSDLGNGSVRLTRGVADALAVGDLVSLTLPTQIPHGLLLQDSNKVTLQDVRVHASTSFGVFERGGGGNTFNNIQVVPGPTPMGASEPRLLSANADGFHSKHTSIGPSVIGAHIAAQGDDGIAINTDFHLVGAAGGSQLEVGAKNGSLNFQVGDRIRGYNRTTGTIAEATVQAITRDASLDTGLAAIQATHLPSARSELDTGFRLTLDQPLALNPGDLISSPDRSGAGFQIRDSLIENHRARGMLLKATDGLVENNTVDGSTIGGIVLLAEPTTWQEAGFSENVVIRGNTVRNTGRQFSDPTNTVGGGIVVAASQGWVGRHHSNILIEDNVVDSVTGPGLIISLADGVQVRSNQFSNTHPLERTGDATNGFDPTAVVWIDDAANVSLSGNTVRNLGPFGDNLVRATTNTSALSGRDTGIRVIHDAPAMTIADYRDDYQSTTPAAGWQYLWNSDGIVGDPANYESLVSTGGDYTSDGSLTPTANPAARFARLGSTNGHAGTGANQAGSGGIGRGVIAAYTIQSDGEYAIRDSFVMSNTNGSGLDLTVHINGEAALLYDFIESGATASFDVQLGELSAGDTIYVAFGPGNFSTSDFFALDFSVALLVPLGDFNRDGRVNAADYTVWRDTRGQTGVGLPADVTGEDLQGIPDGVVDESDYALWRANFGIAVPAGASSASSLPEPQTLTFVLAALLCGRVRCRGRVNDGERTL
jgi:hypothetical protein